MRYKCKSCNAVFEVFVITQGKLAILLKFAFCPYCGKTTLEGVRL